ncbi:hypothetical protein [Formosa haliotis]|uniref:hypothetical protein n=1 Tax=Formosa haliotis TaxID=1555194 RepID=UPI000826300B|nr:hypothetical protein [Formosa haliotis]
MKKQLLTCFAIFGSLIMNAQGSLLFDIAPGSSGSDPDQMYLYNGKIYFQADTGFEGSPLANNEDIGDELWILDPSNETLSYMDLNPGTGNSSPGDFLNTVVNFILVIQTRHITLPMVLWRIQLKYQN